MESELIVHWGRRCCTASCSRIVHVRALLPCPVRSKLTSSGKRALQAARTWGLRVAGFGASIPIPIIQTVLAWAGRLQKGAI